MQDIAITTSSTAFHMAIGENISNHTLEPRIKCFVDSLNILI